MLALDLRMRERRVDQAKRARFEQLRLDLQRRLTKACCHLSPVELETLTARMTRLRVKYATVTALPEM